MIDWGSFEASIEHHLQYNVYPPITLEMVPFCRRALELTERGEGGELLEFPDGTKIPAQDICSDLKLEYNV